MGTFQTTTMLHLSSPPLCELHPFSLLQRVCWTCSTAEEAEHNTNEHFVSALIFSDIGIKCLIWDLWQQSDLFRHWISFMFLLVCLFFSLCFVSDPEGCPTPHPPVGGSFVALCDWFIRDFIYLLDLVLMLSTDDRIKIQNTALTTRC